MERLQALPNAAEYFTFTRRFVGNPERTIRQIPPAEAFKSFDMWVGQAIAALAKLHDAGFLHGSLDPSALVINGTGDLRLGGLQKIREDVGSGDFQPTNLVLPPEQNLYAAFQASIPFNTAFQALQQANWSMDQLQSIFPSFDAGRPHMFALYEKIQVPSKYAEIQEAGDVWMLGFSLLTVYYEMLAKWPYAAGEEFYQNKNEAFHDLIETMTRLNPDHRIRAVEALKVWAPNSLPSETSETPSPSETSETPSPSETVPETPLPSETVPETHLPSDTSETVPVKRRPYLALQSHPAGRNKTRRNLRN